ncbi:helix-turn-helix transcriptional regulator [Saccharicrinis aurantiacus]|uniref:helix-turn-helix transcriptional regulator n=1 Tax=Saccharicrinis aurantiacus TaxID=1849719 RepID=UPI000837E032|nr:helix-turn-helix transcriptional regulator [Saccharicrinis aurantiacus]
MSDKELHIKVQEGPGVNYIKALHDVLGGEFSVDSYKLENGDSSIMLQSVEVIDGMELLLTDARYNKHVVIERIADGESDYIHISFFKKGQVPHTDLDRRLLIEADTLLGAYVHNGLFPFVTEFPANMKVKTITYKLTKGAFLNLLPEADHLYKSLFGTQDPVAYHMPLSTQVERLTDDIFYFNEQDYGRVAFIKARAIEAFCVFIMNAEQHLIEGGLKGLHKEDYSKLLLIKEKLLSSFNQKITIQGLSEEFGVSVSKLKRDFKTLFDCSIYQFYTHAKMDEAYRLLKTGNLNITQVGFELGYTNMSKFTEMFKKVKGILPNEVVKLGVI